MTDDQVGVPPPPLCLDYLANLQVMLGGQGWGRKQFDLIDLVWL